MGMRLVERFLMGYLPMLQAARGDRLIIGLHSLRGNASAHFDALYPTEMFPFTDLPQTDLETQEKGGLLDRCDAAGVTPRVFYTNTSTEYWNRGASLVHTDVDGQEDVEIHPSVRVYHFASTKHGPG